MRRDEAMAMTAGVTPVVIPQGRRGRVRRRIVAGGTLVKAAAPEPAPKPRRRRADGPARAIWAKLFRAEAELASAHAAAAPEKRIAALRRDRDRLQAAFRAALADGESVHREEAAANVENPLRHAGGPRFETVRVNIAQHPIEWLRARRLIDRGQYDAARLFEEVHRRAAIGRVGAFDPTKVSVDGGAPADPIAVATMAAAKRLMAWRAEAGELAFAIARAICVEGVTAAAAGKRFARELGCGERAAKVLAMDHLRRFLDRLPAARAASGPARGRIGAARGLGGDVPDGFVVADGGYVVRAPRAPVAG